MKTFKKLSENYDQWLFKNWYLTDLMLLKKNNRNIKITSNYALFLLLDEKLQQYGIQILNQFERNNLTFRSIRLLKDFPIENEPILKQLYGFKGFIAPIQLNGFEDAAFAFDYNTESGECELQKHCWGTIVDRRVYTSLSKMLYDIKFLGYNKIF